MPRQDARRDRQRIDAGIEHPETAGLPDPLLTRMPAADILLPDDIDAAALAFGEPGARRRAEEHKPELQSIMRIPYERYGLRQKKKTKEKSHSKRCLVHV